MAAAWKAGVDEGSPTDMGRRRNRPLATSRAALGMPPAFSASSKTSRESPSIWTTRNLRRGFSSVSPSRAHRAIGPTSPWRARTSPSGISGRPYIRASSLPGKSLPRLGRPYDAGLGLPPRDLGGDAPGRLVVGLPGQHEGTPVDASEALGAEVGPGLERLLGRDVHGAGDLPRCIGANGQGGEVEGPQRVADVLEVRVIARVSREVEALGAQNRPRRPKPAALVDHGAARAMLGGSTDDGQPLEGNRLPPPELDGVGDAPIGQPRLESPRHNEGRIGELGEAAHGWPVEVIVA